MAEGGSDRWRLRDDEVRVRLARLGEWLAHVDELAGLLDTAERARAARTLDDDARTAYVAAHGLLRRWLSELSDLPPEGFVFEAGADGKPRLADHPRLHFSLSHTRGMVAAAVALGRPLGIDVELVHDEEPDGHLLALTLTEAERRGLASLPSAARRDAFFRAWTRKEALLKATGEGLTGGLAEIDVFPRADAAGHPLLLQVGDDNEAFEVVDLAVPAGFCGAVAWAVDGRPSPRLDVLLDRPAKRRLQ